MPVFAADYDPCLSESLCYEAGVGCNEKLTLPWLSPGNCPYQTGPGGMAGSSAFTQLLLLACMDLPQLKTWEVWICQFLLSGKSTQNRSSAT